MKQRYINTTLQDMAAVISIAEGIRRGDPKSVSSYVSDASRFGRLVGSFVEDDAQRGDFARTCMTDADGIRTDGPGVHKVQAVADYFESKLGVAAYLYLRSYGAIDAIRGDRFASLIDQRDNGDERSNLVVDAQSGKVTIVLGEDEIRAIRERGITAYNERLTFIETARDRQAKTAGSQRHESPVTIGAEIAVALQAPERPTKSAAPVEPALTVKHG